MLLVLTFTLSTDILFVKGGIKMQKNDLFDRLGISEENFNKSVDEYMKSPEYTEYMKELHKKHHKEKVLKVAKWLKVNFWNITTLVIGVVTLIFSVLGYLKG